MNTFDQANQALRSDIAEYAKALRTIVESLPQALLLCEKTAKEVRLAQALLAFANSPHTAPLAQLVYLIGNLWPYRDRTFARTVGFKEEIDEARAYQAEAKRGIAMLARHIASDPLASELTTCFTNIVKYLEKEEALLLECDRSIRPHAVNMDITRKRLHLLIAAIDARIEPSPEATGMLEAYSEAARLLQDWESGVPLDERGIEILETSLDLLERATLVFPTAWLKPGDPAAAAS